MSRSGIELQESVKSWIEQSVSYVARKHPDAIATVELEVRFGTVDLRYGTRLKLAPWSEESAKFDLVCHPCVGKPAFRAGTSYAAIANVDRVIASAKARDSSGGDAPGGSLLRYVKGERSVTTPLHLEAEEEDKESLRQLLMTSGKLEEHKVSAKRRMVSTMHQNAHVETKYALRECEQQLVLPGFVGDLRLATAIESSQPLQPADAARLKMEAQQRTFGENRQERHRTRPFFVSLDPSGGGDGVWEVHRTQVCNSEIGGRPVGVGANELECELSAKWFEKLCTVSIRGDDPEQYKSMCVLAASELVTLVHLLLPKSQEPVPATLSVVSDADRAQTVAKLMSLELGNDRRFPGCNPVALRYDDLFRLRRRDPNGTPHFLLTEKTNGHRAILVASTDPMGSMTYVFMTRECKCYQRLDLGPTNAFARQMQESGEFVLDGEFVWNPRLKRMMYVAFDVLALHGSCLINQTFEGRVKILDDLRRKSATAVSCVVDDELIVVFKEWVPPNKLYSSFEMHIQQLDGERVFVHPTDARRQNGSDGYICQSTKTPYVMGTDFNALKYKTPDQLSIDLMVDLDLLRKGNLQSRKLVYFFQRRSFQNDGEKNRQYVSCNIGVHEALRILASASPNASSIVCEFVYRRSHWHFLFPRADKHLPNNPLTVASSEDALKDNITLATFVITTNNKRPLESMLHFDNAVSAAMASVASE